MEKLSSKEIEEMLKAGKLTVSGNIASLDITSDSEDGMSDGNNSATITATTRTIGSKNLANVCESSSKGTSTNQFLKANGTETKLDDTSVTFDSTCGGVLSSAELKKLTSLTSYFVMILKKMETIHVK